MINSNKKNIFIVWKIFQRRAESLAPSFDLDVINYHYSWEEKSKTLKVLSYLFKSIMTFIDLIRCRPDCVFVQLPPTPALYVVALYCSITNKKYVLDCHNAMICGWWIKWPFARYLLKKAEFVFVHNQDVSKYAADMSIIATVLRDPLPKVPSSIGDSYLAKYGLQKKAYVLAPWNFASDEPIAEMFHAATDMPDIKIVMTWFPERLSKELIENKPSNVIFTGYIDVDEFNEIFANAMAAIILTTREGTQPSGASEAIALGVPLVISDLETTRMLYKDAPMYVENNSKSIVNGIESMCKNIKIYECNIMKLNENYQSELNAEINDVKKKLHSNKVIQM